MLGTVKACTGAWCRIIGKDFDGWIEQDDLWGVYPEREGRVILFVTPWPWPA